MKICDLTQFYSPVSGGVRRYLEQKARYLRERCPGDRHVLVVPGDVTGRSGDDIARVYTIASPLVSRTARYRSLLKLHLVEEVLERERPDIIESGDPYQLAWKAVASGRGLGIPVVGFYHSHFPEAFLRSVKKFTSRAITQILQDCARRYVKSLYNHFATTFVPSPALAELLHRWGVERTESVDLGVDTAVFRPGVDGREEMRGKLEVAGGQIALLYVGRLASEKNVETLFEAFRQLAPTGRWRLIVVGDGSLRSLVMRLREESGLVTWIPYCSEPEDLAAIYRAADVFVHPGIQETFGLVTLESQACGTPVVGIRGSYMDRIILTDQLHWADENTPESLAGAIVSKCTVDLQSRGLAASDAVRARFSWDSAFARIRETYEKVIEGERGR